MALPVDFHRPSTPLAPSSARKQTAPEGAVLSFHDPVRSVRRQAAAGFVRGVRHRYLGVLFPDDRHGSTHQGASDHIVEASDWNDFHAALDRIGYLREILGV